MVGADHAWLRMERPASPMVITGFFELAAPVALDRVRATLEERLLRFERFTQRVAADGRSRSWWQPDPGFDLERHVVAAPDLDPADPFAFGRLVDRLASSHLDPGRPLWEIQVVESHGAGSALVARLHHSIADGIALMQILLSLCDRADGTPAFPGGGAGDTPARPLLERARRGLGILGSATHLALLRPDPPSRLKSPLTGAKRTAWSQPIDLGELRSAGRGLGVTVNDLLLAAMSGSLRRYLLEDGGIPSRDLRAMVPFNLRPPEVGRPLGNRFGLVLPALPVVAPNPGERLATVTRRMLRIKETPEAAAAYAILAMMGGLSAGAQAAVVRFFATKSSAVITNVPGPAEQISFAGSPIERIMFWVPQAGGIGLGVSLLSYAGSTTVGVIADSGVVDDPGRLVAGFHDELETLGRMAGRRPG